MSEGAIPEMNLWSWGGEGLLELRHCSVERHPNRGAKPAVGWMSLEFRGAISARDLNWGVLGGYNTDEISC